MNSVKPAKTFGSELVTNGDFSDGVNDWTANANATLSVDSGRLKVTISGGSGYPYQSITTEVGKLYKVTADGFIGTSSRLALYNSADAQFRNLYADGRFDFTFTATSTSTQLRLYVYDDGAYGLWDNVSVKEVTEADFDFTRGSSATRVNELGLVQDVQLLSGELVQNGDFEQIGSEQIVNGSFDTDSNWVKGSGWSIDNGSLNGVNATSSTYQNNGLVSGKFYKVVYEVSNYSSGTVQLKLGGTLGQARSENGTYTEYIKATQVITWVVGTNFSGSIDNVSVKEVGQNWTFNTGWSIEDGKVYFDNSTGTELYQSLSTSASKYRISFDLDITSGTIQTSFSSPSTSTIKSFTTSGTKTVDITTTASFSRFRFVGLGWVSI